MHSCGILDITYIYIPGKLVWGCEEHPFMPPTLFTTISTTTRILISEAFGLWESMQMTLSLSFIMIPMPWQVMVTYVYTRKMLHEKQTHCTPCTFSYTRPYIPTDKPRTHNRMHKQPDERGEACDHQNIHQPITNRNTLLPDCTHCSSSLCYNYACQACAQSQWEEELDTMQGRMPDRFQQSLENPSTVCSRVC